MKPQQSFLTDRFFLLTLLIQFVGLLCFTFPILLPIYIGSLAVLALWAAFDYFSLPRARELVGRCQVGPDPEITKPVAVLIQVIAKGDAWRSIRGITLLAPGLDTLEFENKRLFAAPQPARDHVLESSPESGFAESAGWTDDDTAFSFPLQGCASALGYREISSLQLHVRSRGSLWFRSLSLSIPACGFRVIPTRKDISEQAFHQLVRELSILHQGNRRLMRGRSAELFHSIRKYQFPDPIRHIDAKKTAKYGQLMTRIHDNLLNHHLIVALDLSRTMSGWLGPSRKHDYYLSACLTLARNAVKSRDRVSLLAFSQKKLHFISRTRHMSDFHPLHLGAEHLQPREEEADFELLLPVLARFSGQQNIVLLLTDVTRPSVQDSVLNILPAITRRNLVATISLIDSQYHLNNRVIHYPRTADLETCNKLFYSYELNDQLLVFKKELARYGAGAVLASETDWLSVIQKTYSLLRESRRL